MHLYTDESNIDTTSNHPFYVIGTGWVAAGDLAIGDEVYNLDGTTSSILGSEIEVLDEPLLVYNLEVEDLHSYFVGCVPVLVHNYESKGETLLQATTKQAAKESISNLPEAIQASAKRFFNGGSSKYNNFSVAKQPDGNYILSMTKPGDVPGSRAEYYKIITPDGVTVDVYKNTYGPDGELIHSKPK